MSENIIVALITAIGAFLGVYYANRKSAAVMEYRLKSLEEKVSKHNNLVERMYSAEERLSVLDEKQKVANHRLDDLEHKE